MKTSVLVYAAVLGLSYSVGLSAPVLAQTVVPAPPSTDYRAPRNAAGQPDLQGIWTNGSLTPLEREAELGDRAVLTAEEVAKVEGQEAAHVERQNLPTDPDAPLVDPNEVCGRGGQTGAACGYNTAWTDPGSRVMRVGGEPRSSFITSPANGRVPPPTEDGRRRFAQLAAQYRNLNAADNPESRSLGERCLLSFGYSAGPVMLPLLYNNNYQIVQTKDEVAILVEMVHDVRHIRLNQSHRADSLPQWLGDSVGRWDGDTLVIETTHFRPDQAIFFRGATRNLKVTETLTRVAEDRLHYGFLVEDPATFSEAWAGEYEFSPADGRIYEYACHEGNYGIVNVLQGAREAEKTVASPAPETAAN